MKLFIDTNIFIEYFEKRQHFESVRLLFNALEDGIHTGYISTGSFYTLAYIVDQGFKRKGYNKLERLDFVRSVLLGVLDLVTVIEIDNSTLRKGINDYLFTDLEDSFQYQASLTHQCDILVTLNTKDFKGADPNFVQIISPQQFVEEYL